MAAQRRIGGLTAGRSSSRDPMDGKIFDSEFLMKLERLALLAKRFHRGRTRGEHLNYKKGSSLEFYDYRHYQPGDDVRYIDWNIWGRLDRLFVKLFQAEEDLTIHLLVDTSKSMDFGDPLKFDYARRVGAALGYIGIKSLDRVGVSTFTDNLGTPLNPMRRQSHIFSLFEYFSRMKADGETDFNGCIEKYAARTGRPGLAVVISDMMIPRGWEAGLLSLVYRKFDIILVHVMDDEELSPTVDGYLRLVDGENGRSLNLTVDRAVRRLYLDKLESHFRSIERFSARHGIEYLRTSTSIPFEDLILRYLRQGTYLH
jgi:uncharacterized protein (DUF58 family)